MRVPKKNYPLQHDIDYREGQADTTWVPLGGASGIGLAAAEILAEKGASVHVLDLNLPEQDVPGVRFHKCNVARWEELRDAFDVVGPVDYAFANAGVSEEADYFADQLDGDGKLVEPAYRVLDINVRAVYNFVKLAWSSMRKRENRPAGSIVITISSTAYAPEQSLPVYSSGKLAVSLTLLCLLRSNVLSGHAPASKHVEANTLEEEC